jgi:hypothetical protein
MVKVNKPLVAFLKPIGNLLFSSKTEINSSEELLAIAVKYNKMSIYE